MVHRVVIVVVVDIRAHIIIATMVDTVAEVAIVAGIVAEAAVATTTTVAVVIVIRKILNKFLHHGILSDNRRNRYEPYHRRDRGGGNASGAGPSDRPYEHRNRNEHQAGGSGPPMKVRRDYGNFVPASKE